MFLLISGKALSMGTRSTTLHLAGAVEVEVGLELVAWVLGMVAKPMELSTLVCNIFCSTTTGAFSGAGNVEAGRN